MNVGVLLLIILFVTEFDRSGWWIAGAVAVLGVKFLALFIKELLDK